MQLCLFYGLSIRKRNRDWQGVSMGVCGGSMPEVITATLGDGSKVVGTVQSSPVAGTVLVDTGALAANNYLFGFVVSHSASVILDVQHRNATNTGDVDTPIRLRFSGDDTEYPIWPSKIALVTSERIRVVMAASVIGDIQVAVFIAPVA